MVVTQPSHATVFENVSIPGLSKEHMMELTDLDDEVERFSMPKKPDMPVEFSLNQKPYDYIEKVVVSLIRAQELDYSFLSNVLQDTGNPEFSGFNTQVFWESGMQTACESAVQYMPLFNMKPANPNTVNTAIVKGLRLIGRVNQYYLVMTAGMQIYKITVNIILQLLIWELKSYLFSAACISSWILYPVFAHSCLVVVRRVYFVKSWGRWISCWRERRNPRIYVHSAS